MNTEKMSSRKEWVKNAAIIFLSVMLVLTFFSNTIMNYSLPEVATAMIEPGSITAKIRGTGNLTSDDPYKITIQESRKIASVAVKQGDVVEKDQVLFYLEDEDSLELEEAEKALDELILAYSTTILSGDISKEAYQNIQGGKVSSNAEYQNQINAAKQKVEDAQARVDSLEKQIAITGTVTSDSIDKESALKEAQTELDEAKARRSQAEENLKTAQDNAGGVSAVQAKYNNALLDEGLKKTAYETAANYLYGYLKNSAINRPDSIYISVFISEFSDVNKFMDNFEGIIGNSEKMKLLTNSVLEADGIGMGSVSANDVYTGEAGRALTELQTAYGDYKTAVSTTTTIKAELDVKQGNSDVAGYQQAYNEAQGKYEYWKEVYDNLQKEINDQNKEQ